MRPAAAIGLLLALAAGITLLGPASAYQEHRRHGGGGGSAPLAARDAAAVLLPVPGAPALPPGSGGDYESDRPERLPHLAHAGRAAPHPAGRWRHRARRGSGGRCAGTAGAWCGAFYAQAPLAYKRPPALSKPCPGGCSGIGVCHGDTGACDCPAGAGGPACADHAKRPCTNGFRLPRNGSVPKGHIGADMRDLDWLAAGNTPSRCAGICDDDIAACYCDPQLGNPKYGRIPPPPGSPPGTPPLRQGRPLLEPCSHPARDGAGRKLPWGHEGVSYGDIYGPGGWCVADKPNVTACGCRLDGSDGPGCADKTEMICPNQCSGRGACRLGFCACDPGWWGLDCGHASTEAAAASPPPPLPSWLQGLAIDAWRCAGRGAGCSEDHLLRQDEEWRAELAAEEAGRPPLAPVATGSEGGGSNDSGGGSSDSGGGSSDAGGGGLWRLSRRSWRRRLAQRAARGRTPLAGAGAASTNSSGAAGAGNSSAPPQSSSGAGSGAGGVPAPPPGRRRPLIYVYDVPAPYVSRMLSYRMLKDQCSWRWFGPTNSSVIGFFTYATEALLLELLLGSSHRTLDPEEADFFFVPVFSSCMISPVFGWADHPFWYTRSFQRINHAAVMTHELLQWVKTTHPYWNRTAGADHIWHFSHDEGACWAPSEIYNRSIILTHWGRMDAEHESGTSFGPDDYSKDVLDDPFLPGGFKRLISGHPCYTPGKDLVLPSFESPERYHASPFLGAPQPERDILLYHRGRMGEHDLPVYSRGVRQKILKLTQRHNWEGKHKIYVSGYDNLEGDYSEQLARSVFCLVASGDGWTSRFDDAVLHGCIPVVVIDRVVGPWGHQLRWQAFSVRVAEADVEKLPDILLAIPPARVRQMQRIIANVWRRFAWLSHPEVYRQVRQAAKANADRIKYLKILRGEHPAQNSNSNRGGGSSSSSGGSPELQRALHALAPGAWRDDAFHTLLQWLYHKLEERQAVARGGAVQRR